MTRSLLPPCFRRSSVRVRASTTNRHRVCPSSPDTAISPRRVHSGPESLVIPLPVHRPSGRISRCGRLWPYFAEVMMSQPVSTSPTVLITGATDGIGYATARRFVDDGATVYLHAPDHDSGEKALTRLVKDGAEPLRLHVVIPDFPPLDRVADLP